jgi:hypothetical protein
VTEDQDEHHRPTAGIYFARGADDGKVIGGHVEGMDYGVVSEAQRTEVDDLTVIGHARQAADTPLAKAGFAVGVLGLVLAVMFWLWPL